MIIFLWRCADVWGTKAVDVDESMLGTETLAEMLLLQMHRKDDGPVDP
jgi:hypothetical protein